MEILDGEMIVQVSPMMLHDLPGRKLVRETPEPFEAWNGRVAGFSMASLVGSDF